MTSGRLVLASILEMVGKNPPLSTLASLQTLSTFQRSLQNRFALSFGTGAGQFNTMIANAYELAASGTNTHNFFDGSVPDVFAVASGLQNIKALMVYLVPNTDNSTGASSITIGNAAADPLALNLGGTTPTYQHYKESLPFMAGRRAGYTVNNTTKNVRIANNDGANKATYWLLAAGVKV